MSSDKDVSVIPPKFTPEQIAARKILSQKRTEPFSDEREQQVIQQLGKVRTGEARREEEFKRGDRSDGGSRGYYGHKHSKDRESESRSHTRVVKGGVYSGDITTITESFNEVVGAAIYGYIVTAQEAVPKVYYVQTVDGKTKIGGRFAGHEYQSFEDYSKSDHDVEAIQLNEPIALSMALGDYDFHRRNMGVITMPDGSKKAMRIDFGRALEAGRIGTVEDRYHSDWRFLGERLAALEAGKVDTAESAYNQYVLDKRLNTTYDGIHKSPEFIAELRRVSTLSSEHLPGIQNIAKHAALSFLENAGKELDSKELKNLCLLNLGKVPINLERGIKTPEQREALATEMAEIIADNIKQRSTLNLRIADALELASILQHKRYKTDLELQSRAITLYSNAFKDDSSLPSIQVYFNDAFKTANLASKQNFSILQKESIISVTSGDVATPTTRKQESAVKDAKIRNLMHMTSMAGSDNDAILSIAKEVGLDAKDPRGYTALMYAVANGKDDLVRDLIKAGADVNAQDAEGETALHKVVSQGRNEISSLLMANGADVNSQDNAGTTPLMYAARRLNAELFAELIKNGADINLQNRLGNIALKFLPTQPNFESERVSYLTAVAAIRSHYSDHTEKEAAPVAGEEVRSAPAPALHSLEDLQTKGDDQKIKQMLIAGSAAAPQVVAPGGVRAASPNSTGHPLGL